jgi:acyl dehydratase
MPIDIAKVTGAALPSHGHSWDVRDLILYHLSIGAGRDPVDPEELRYVYEGDLHVVPSFGTIPPFMTMMSFGVVEGVDVSLASILHGEHRLTLHRPIPLEAKVTNEGTVTGIYDKGKGALVELEIVTRLDPGGEVLFTNRPSIFVRGEGGFGGDPGPSSRRETPSREPDRVVETPTLRQQALLYRMSSGDLNPLHADPGFAAFAGYDRPILHGLCTYGIVTKAVVDTVLGGHPSRVGSVSGRFSGVVFPGETIITRIWDEGAEVVVEAVTAERGSPVISNGVVSRAT